MGFHQAYKYWQERAATYPYGDCHGDQFATEDNALHNWRPPGTEDGGWRPLVMQRTSMEHLKLKFAGEKKRKEFAMALLRQHQLNSHR